MGYWTLEYGGVEKALEDWGIVANLPWERFSQAKDVVQVVTVDGFDDAFQWEVDALVIIRQDREGVEGGFVGGSIWFQGYVAEPARVAEGGRENHRYTLYGPWWLLERCSFQQARKTFAGYEPPGDPNGTPQLVTFLTSEFTLGEDIDEVAIDSGEQIVELLEWANECWNPTKRGATVGRDDGQDILQVGTIGVAVPICRQPMRDRKVGELIREMLRWSQDAIAWFDYSTSPPTFHVKKLAALAEVTLNASEERFKRLELKPRYDRQIPGVIVRYKKAVQQDAGIWLSFFSDKYPADLDEYDPDASVHTIELAGTSATTIKATVVTAAMTAAAGSTDDDATRLAWWKAHDTSLADASIVAASLRVSSVTVTEEDGTPISGAAYPNELKPGSAGIADWMLVGGAPAVSKSAIVRATVSYTKRKAGVAADFEIVSAKPVHQRITVTNVSSGEYSALASYDSGEDPPGWVGPGANDFEGGLAQSLYEGFSALQYEGSPTLVSDEINGEVGLGKKLTIVTPGGSYAGILIQGVSGELCSGTVSLQLGPPGQIGLTDMIEILRVNRHRIIYNLPSNRSTGAASGGSQVDLGNKSATDNTLPGHAEKSLLGAVADVGGGNVCMPQIDATNQKIVLHVVDADGVESESFARVKMLLADLGGREAKFRWLYFKDAKDSCAAKKMMVLATEPEADT
jgi:hypothetical protein